ncbi:LCP family protein [uncultured Veillonella sp.]|uniref:LCP family protein n=1 Tax=uncultured Veillonella sp. TaxID=159268 RepID=UPI0025D7A2E9|nr:LCP family protein [uncultured Veillonella sp.]MDY3974555.1 LCP family protein [Veillonella caviae]
MEEHTQAKSKQRRQKKGKILWGRVILAVVIFLLLLCGLVFGVMKGYEYITRPTDQVVADPIAEEPNKPKGPTVPLEQKSLDKPIYILLIGKDSNNPAQGDATFLVSVNKTQKIVDVIGIPSNTKIDSRDKKSVSMLNTIYTSGGIELTKAVVEDLFHIIIPYYVVVDEAAFKKSVDVLGAPDMYVERNMVHMDTTIDKADVNLARGYQNLDAHKALQYVRFVDEDTNAFSRTQRQERFIKELLSSQENAFTVTKMWNTWRLWSSFESNISTSDAVRLVMDLGGLNSSQIHYYILPGTKEDIGGQIYWNYDPTEAQQLVGITLGSIPSDGTVTPGDEPEPAKEG